MIGSIPLRMAFARHALSSYQDDVVAVDHASMLRRSMRKNFARFRRTLSKAIVAYLNWANVVRLPINALQMVRRTKTAEFRR
jgi:hypothetical protein